MLSLKIKAIIGAIILGLLVYSHIWTLNKGVNMGKSECQVESVQALKEALENAQNEFNGQRALEMREAAEVAKQLNQNNQRLAKDNQKLHELLKKEQNKDFARIAVPDDVIGLLNGSRGSTSPQA